MVLRVAWRTRSDYEWVQHVRLAHGLRRHRRGDRQRSRDGADADGWTPLEADLLAATDQLIDGYRIDDATWARLAEHLDERQLVEVVFVVGTYTVPRDGVQQLRAAARPRPASHRDASLPDPEE